MCVSINQDTDEEYSLELNPRHYSKRSTPNACIDWKRYGCYKFLLYQGIEVTTSEQDLGAEVCARLERAAVEVRTQSA